PAGVPVGAPAGVVVGDCPTKGVNLAPGCNPFPPGGDCPVIGEPAGDVVAVGKLSGFPAIFPAGVPLGPPAGVAVGNFIIAGKNGDCPGFGVPVTPFVNFCATSGGNVAF